MGPQPTGAHDDPPPTADWTVPGWSAPAVELLAPYLDDPGHSLWFHGVPQHVARRVVTLLGPHAHVPRAGRTPHEMLALAAVMGPAATLAGTAFDDTTVAAPGSDDEPTEGVELHAAHLDVTGLTTELVDSVTARLADVGAHWELTTVQGRHRLTAS